jgi:hypothetical protein
MLGGDNMDLTLARIVETRLGGGRLNAGELVSAFAAVPER